MRIPFVSFIYYEEVRDSRLLYRTDPSREFHESIFQMSFDSSSHLLGHFIVSSSDASADKFRIDSGSNYEEKDSTHYNNNRINY